jgi:hypothetical protein
MKQVNFIKLKACRVGVKSGLEIPYKEKISAREEWRNKQQTD